MTQDKFVNAYKTIQKFYQKELPLEISHGFFKLKKLLQDQWDFQLEKEEEIFKKYDASLENQQVVCKNPADLKAFNDDMVELSKLDVEWDKDKLQIPFNGRIDFSIEDIESLDPFIEF